MYLKNNRTIPRLNLTDRMIKSVLHGFEPKYGLNYFIRKFLFLLAPSVKLIRVMEPLLHELHPLLALLCDVMCNTSNCFTTLITNLNILVFEFIFIVKPFSISLNML